MFEKHRTASGREPDNVVLLCSLKSLLLRFFGFVLLVSCGLGFLPSHCLFDFRKCFHEFLLVLTSVGMYANVSLYLTFWDCFLGGFWLVFIVLCLLGFFC